MSVSELLNIIGLLFVLLFVVQLVAVMRIYKGLLFRSIRIFTSISLRGANVLLLIGGTLTLLEVIFRDLLSSWIPPFPPILMTGLGFVGIGVACLPPGVVYLGASESYGFSFVHKLMFAIPPIKVVHLLNTFKAGGILREQIDHGGYRVTKGWHKAVHRLCDIAPLIILDLRIVTPFVEEEVQHIFDSGHKHKAVFLTEEDGTLPIPRSLNFLHNGFIFTLTPEAAIATLKGVGWRVLIRGREALNEMIETKFPLQ